jgi:hypothetical protein
VSSCPAKAQTAFQSCFGICAALMIMPRFRVRCHLFRLAALFAKQKFQNRISIRLWLFEIGNMRGFEHGDLGAIRQRLPRS